MGLLSNKSDNKAYGWDKHNCWCYSTVYTYCTLTQSAWCIFGTYYLKLCGFIYFLPLSDYLWHPNFLGINTVLTHNSYLLPRAPAKALAVHVYLFYGIIKVLFYHMTSSSLIISFYLMSWCAIHCWVVSDWHKYLTTDARNGLELYPFQ